MSSKRLLGALLFLTTLFSSATPVLADEPELNRPDTNTRNTIALDMGNVAHKVIEGYFTVYGKFMHGFSQIYVERVLPFAPKIWDGSNPSKERGGKADMIFRFDGTREDGGNYCEVYEIKPATAMSTGYGEIGRTQVIAYQMAIDKDLSLPCLTRESKTVQYPTRFYIPTAFLYPELDIEGLKLWIMTNCTTDTPGNCGMIWYGFEWTKEMDDLLAKDEHTRSKRMGEALARIMIKISGRRPKSESDLRELVANLETLLIDKEEVVPGYDAFTQLINVYRPDGTIDPWVRTTLTMQYLNDYMRRLEVANERAESDGAFWDFLKNLINTRLFAPVPDTCPYTSQKAKDRMCA